MQHDLVQAILSLLRNHTHHPQIFGLLHQSPGLKMVNSK